MLKEIIEKFSNITGKDSDNYSESDINLLETKQLTDDELFFLSIYKARLLLNKNRLQESEKILEKLVSSLNREHLVFKAYLYKLFIKLKAFQGKHKESLSYAQKSFQLAEKTEPVMFPYRYHNLAYAHMVNHNFDKAEEFFVKSILYAKEINDDNIKYKAFSSLASVYIQQGLYLEAQEYLKKALEYFSKKDQKMFYYDSLLSFGLIQMNLENISNAISVFKELIKYFEEINNDRMIGIVRFNLGLCYRKINDYQKSEKAYLSSLDIFKLLKNKELIQKCYNNLSNLYHTMGRFDDAMEFSRKAYDLNKEMNDEFNMKLIRHNIIGIMLSNDRFFPGMKSEIEENEEYFKDKDENISMQCKKLLAQYYSKKKDFRQAYIILDSLDTKKDEYFKRQLHEKTNEFYELIKKTIKSRERVQSILEPALVEKIQHDLIGSSEAIRIATETAKKASQAKDTNVLITGESGTGKEILSRLIHFNSERKENRLVTVNCSAVSSTLAESEFFGHVKGAFTGAIADSKGYFEQAHHGTLYLDEIGDMPIHIQSKILRAIESGRITRVGDSKDMEVDVRIVSSTNKDLNQMIIDNKFRLDLYHRINVINIEIPPLRERGEDLVILTDYFVHKFSNQLKKKITYDDSYLQTLRNYSFPGNVRELKNIIERSIILEPSGTLSSNILKEIQPKQSSNIDLPATYNLAEIERNVIFAALKKSKNSQRKAAKLIGLSESALSRRLKKLRVII